MNLSIKEFAQLTGVSVRTLHYYDEIGLLKPAAVDEQNGYRFYDEASLERMQEILFYRELDFPLKSICEILSSPHYDKRTALAKQKKLLLLKKERLERLIAALERSEKGTVEMKAFDNTEFETARKAYEAEAKEKWGKTEAWREHAEKTKGYSGEKWQSLGQDMDSILAAFACCKNSGALPDSVQAQELVALLQSHITAGYYTCTKEILAGLGQMYVGDERFRKNIDAHGEGTAAYISEAIAAYCK